MSLVYVYCIWCSLPFPWCARQVKPSGPIGYVICCSIAPVTMGQEHNEYSGLCLLWNIWLNVHKLQTWLRYFIQFSKHYQLSIVFSQLSTKVGRVYWENVCSHFIFGITVDYKSETRGSSGTVHCFSLCHFYVIASAVMTEPVLLFHKWELNVSTMWFFSIVIMRPIFHKRHIFGHYDTQSYFPRWSNLKKVFRLGPVTVCKRGGSFVYVQGKIKSVQKYKTDMSISLSLLRGIVHTKQKWINYLLVTVLWKRWVSDPVVQNCTI